MCRREARGAWQLGARRVGREQRFVEREFLFRASPSWGWPSAALLPPLRLKRYSKCAVQVPNTVSVLGRYYSGQNYQAQLADKPDEPLKSPHDDATRLG